MSERRSSLSFERIADRYDATRGGEQRGRRTAATLAPLLDPAAPVLEVGIGTGIVALGLRQHDFTVVGVDLAPAMAQGARRQLGPVVAVADAAHLPIADATIQQAVSVWLLHLVADRAVVLAEVARALRPGGRYLVCPAWGRVRPQDEIERLLVDMRNQLDPTGGWRDDEGQVLDAAQFAGFTVVDQRLASLGEVPQSPAEVADKLTRSRPRPGRTCGTSPMGNGERWSRPPLPPFERSLTPTSNADTTYPCGPSCCNEPDRRAVIDHLPTRLALAGRALPIA